MKMSLGLFLAGWGLVFVCGPHWLQARSAGALAVMALTILAAAALHWFRGRKGWVWLFFPLGACLADARLLDVQVTLSDAFAVPRLRTLNGWVCSEPLLRGERLQFDFCLIGVEHERLPADSGSASDSAHGAGGATKGLYPGPTASQRVSMTCHRCRIVLVAGGVYRLTARITTVHPLQNPGDRFVWQRAWRHGAWQGSVKQATALEPPFLLARQVFLWRRTVLEGARQSAGGMQHRSTLLAMVLGDGSLLQDSDWEQLRQSGLMHLVVVSGLHVSAIVALTVMAVGAALRRGGVRRARTLAHLAGAAMVLLFLLLTGLAVPVLRASLMTLVVITALLLKLRAAWFEIYLLALCGTLWIDPFAFVTPGFWLSFAAVLVLLLSSANRGSRRGRPWIEMVRLQALLSLTLMPLTGFFYGEASLSAFFLNLLAVPLVTLLILPLALLKFVLAAVGVPPPLAQILDGVLDALLGCFWWLAQVGDSLAALAMRQVTLSQLLLVVVLALALVVLRRPVLLAWLLAGLAVLGTAPRPDPGDGAGIRVVLLDVGQGLAVAVQQGGQWLLYDTGPAWPEGWNSGEQVIVPFFRRAGLDAIDTLIVSHGDNDHAGGAAAVAESLDIARVFLGEPGRHPELSGNACQAGQRLLLGQAVITLLWPLPAEVEHLERNNLSCTFLLEYGGRRMMFPGDLEVRAQRRLVEIYGDALRADVLLIPHHGARSSFLPDFISRVDPALVVGSAGYRNRFGHPHPVVTKWLEGRDIPLAMTSRQGAIELFWQPGGAIERRAHGVHHD